MSRNPYVPFARKTGGYIEKKVPTGEFEKPPTTQGKDMSGWLQKAFKPTGRNVPNITDSQLRIMEDITDKVLSLETPLPSDIKALKDRIATKTESHKSMLPKEPIDAFTAPIVKRLDDLLRKEVKDYGTLVDKYGAHLNDQQRIVEAFV